MQKGAYVFRRSFFTHYQACQRLIIETHEISMRMTVNVLFQCRTLTFFLALLIFFSIE
jgi:hypothetical protein